MLASCAIAFVLVRVQDQDSAGSVLAKYGLTPNITIVSTKGKATLAQDETIEFVGGVDLKSGSDVAWDIGGRGLDKQGRERFWQILDLSPAQRSDFSEDPDGRTFAMAFQLSPNLSKALNVVELPTARTFVPLMAVTKAHEGYVGEARIVGPITKTGAFDFTLEVPGGPWVTLAEFPFGPDTEINGIKFVQRWRNSSDFRTVDGEEKVIEYKDYYFTLSFPPALREMELEIITNDPPEDAPLLPSVITQHIKGELQGESFAGFDLFLVHGLRSRGAERRFTLRARPRRFVVFKAIPVTS